MIQPANTDEELWWKFDMAIRFEAGPSLELDLNWGKIQAHWPLEEGQQPETPGEIPDDVLAELQKIVDKLPPPKKYTKKSLKKSCVFEPLNLRSFKARVVADYATGWNWPWHYSSSACAQDRCLVSVNCPSGQTMVQCEAAPTFGASTASGGARVSGSSCQATGGKLGANIQQGSWKEGNKDSWTSWASCPSGTVAVTPAGLYAGNTFGGYDTAYYLKLMGDRRRRLSYQTKLCPAGQFMKYIKTCAGGRWDSMDYVQCTSGHRIDSSMKQGCDQRRRRRRVEVHAHVQYNNIAGTRKVTGQEQGNADKVCFEGGTCRGNTNSDSYSETCGDRGLLAGWREYDRRRKSFECSSSGCKAECANDKCQIRPNCIQASSSQVTDGPSRKSSGANQWTAWNAHRATRLVMEPPAEDPARPPPIERVFSEGFSTVAGSQSQASLRELPGLSDEWRQGLSDARAPGDRDGNEPDRRRMSRGLSGDALGGSPDRALGYTCHDLGRRPIIPPAPLLLQIWGPPTLHLLRRPRRLPRLRGADGAGESFWEFRGEGRAESEASTLDPLVDPDTMRTLPRMSRWQRRAAAAASRGGDHGQADSGPEWRDEMLRNFGDLRLNQKAPSVWDSRKGPSQGIRYRTGMPPAPPVLHYSQDDLRAYDRWEKRVRIWEMQVASYLPAMNLFVSLKGEAEEELENADLKKINAKEGIEFILSTLRSALKTRAIYQKQKYMHDYEHVSRFANEGVRAFCNRYHRVERALQACRIDIEPMYDSEARGD
eukprot:s3065_g3.t1